jgi:hypothetical protein
MANLGKNKITCNAFFKGLPWLIEICGLRLSNYCNIFYSNIGRKNRSCDTNIKD